MPETPAWAVSMAADGVAVCQVGIARRGAEQHPHSPVYGVDARSARAVEAGTMIEALA